jgi:hypothetical protein
MHYRLGEMEYEEEDHETITDKEFYKAMQKLKDRGSNAVPPKKSASAYIIFGKEVGSKKFSKHYSDILEIEKSRNSQEKSTSQSHRGSQRDSP